MTTPNIILEGNHTPLVDEPPQLRLSGVKPGIRVILRASCVDSSGITYSSWAEYKTRADDAINPARQSPLDGTYHGKDPFGLWWSMTSAVDRAFSRDLRPIATTVSAEIGGERIAEIAFSRLRIAPDIRTVDVRSGGLFATFFVPNAPIPAAAVIVLGGSEGGIVVAEEFAALLASRGFAALAVAYFGSSGLPERLVQIPLEYLQNAAHWLLRRPEVSGSGIGVVGTSRGGELALLLASFFPWAHAVVGFAASSLVWPGFTTGLDACAAWTWEGRDLPFAIPRPQPLPTGASGPLISSPWFLSTLRDRSVRERSTICVERIRGAVLLISGSDDQVWPSRQLAELALRRLARAGSGQPTRSLHLNYPHAGHGVGRGLGLPAAPTIIPGPNGILYALGGSKAGNARSAQHAWPQVLSFLSEHLSVHTTAPHRIR